MNKHRTIMGHLGECLYHLKNLEVADFRLKITKLAKQIAHCEVQIVSKKVHAATANYTSQNAKRGFLPLEHINYSST